jgi:hypothetical protein
MTAAALEAVAREERFSVVERWTEPWYGMRNYCLRRPPTDHEELILVLRPD